MGRALMRLSVLMAVHNGENYLTAALDSLCQQTCPADEVLVVDDASNDLTSSILREYRHYLPLHVVVNEERQGLTRSLQRGWVETRGELIARMDSDDISLPHRFQRQLKRLEIDPTLAFCGTWARAIAGRNCAMKMPIHCADLKVRILWGNPFIHSSVILRKSIFENAGLAYDPTFPVAQDYDLWSRALAEGLSAINLPEYLLTYRVHETNVTAIRGAERREAVHHILSRELQRLCLEASESEIELHRQIAECELPDVPETVQAARKWLKRLAGAWSTKETGPSFLAGLRQAWYSVCYRNLVANVSRCPELYWIEDDFDALGHWRWLLRAAWIKKNCRPWKRGPLVRGPKSHL